MAQAVGRFELENSQASGSHLPESDAAGRSVIHDVVQEAIMDGLQVMPRLDKMAISVSSFDDIEAERQFWFSKGVLERLNAIELQRRMVYGIDRTTSRLQRFFETAELLRD